MRIKNEALELSGTDLESNQTSLPVWLGHIALFSVQVVITGSPNGTLKLQASNDNGANDIYLANASIINWTDIPNQSASISSAGSVIFNVPDSGYKWFRLVWIDASSGSPSTITSARYMLKGI